MWHITEIVVKILEYSLQEERKTLRPLVLFFLQVIKYWFLASFKPSSVRYFQVSLSKGAGLLFSEQVAAANSLDVQHPFLSSHGEYRGLFYGVTFYHSSRNRFKARRKFESVGPKYIGFIHHIYHLLNSWNSRSLAQEIEFISGLTSYWNLYSIQYGVFFVDIFCR